MNNNIFYFIKSQDLCIISIILKLKIANRYVCRIVNLKYIT